MDPVICPRCFSQDVKLINKEKGIYRCHYPCDWVFSVEDFLKNEKSLTGKAKVRAKINRTMKKDVRKNKREKFLARIKKEEEKSEVQKNKN